MVKISRNSMIICRISKLKKRVNLDTQRLREKTLEGLEELFDLAQAMAKSNNVKYKQRQIWARIAAYIGQIMNSIAKGFDERHLNAELDEVERLINEARAKTKAGETEKGVTGTGASTASQGPG